MRRRACRRTRAASARPLRCTRRSARRAECRELAPDGDLISCCPCAKGACCGCLRHRRRSPWPPFSACVCLWRGPSAPSLSSIQAPCGCVFCYYCVAAACHASSRPRCPRCAARLELGARCPADLIPQPPPAAAAPIAAAAGGAPLGQLGVASHLEGEGDAHMLVEGGDGAGDEEGTAEIGFRQAGGGVTWHSDD